MVCFECSQEITDKYFETSGVYIHWSCVRLILNNYIKIYNYVKITGKEPEIVSEALADKLGYTRKEQ
jgi:hypothetical protein